MKEPSENHVTTVLLSAWTVLCILVWCLTPSMTEPKVDWSPSVQSSGVQGQLLR